MSAAASDAALDALLDAPSELAEYERWLDAQPAPSADYLFSEAKARFAADDGDAVRAPPDLVVIDGERGLELGSALIGGGVALGRLPRAAVERSIDLVDGRRTLGELRRLAGADRPVLERICEAALGSVLFVPEAIARLEAEVSGVELVRFVGAPYEIVRAYWANSGAVRRAFAGRLDAFGDRESALRTLRKLHVVLLLGEDLRSFYRPESRIASRGVDPGALYATPSRRVRGETATLLLAGPRVGVNPVGGERYHRAIATAAGDPGALDPERELRDADGLAWGAVVTGRAVDETEDHAWFCPPRPMEEAHFDKLFGAFRAALDASFAGDEPRTIDELARFHRRFVRLHPFRAGNQSLAMNLVNAVLLPVRGAGTPHLLLDQLALRLTEEAYGAVFRLAVDGHSVCAAGAQRWALLAEKKRRLYRVVERVAKARDEREAEAVLDDDVEAARLALIHR